MLIAFSRACRALLLASLTLFLFLPAAHAAADYSVGAEINGSTATLWFRSTVGSTWVDAHYRLDNGAQQNVRMAFNSGTGRFETQLAAASGQTLVASFTYNRNGAAYDSPTETVVIGSGGSGGTGGVTATPVASPAAGTFSTPQSVTLSSATPGAVIRYTTNGSTPGATSPVYAGPIGVSVNTVLKAYATAAGQTDSQVLSASYVIDAAAAPFTQGASAANGQVTLWFSGPANTAWGRCAFQPRHRHSEPAHDGAQWPL